MGTFKREIDVLSAAHPVDLADAPVIILYAQEKPVTLDWNGESVRLGAGDYVLFSGETSAVRIIKSGSLICLGLLGALTEKYAPVKLQGSPQPLMEAGMLRAAVKAVLLENPAQWTDVQRIKLAFDLLLALLAASGETEQKPRLVTEACTVMDSAYGHIYGVEDVADRLGVSKAHLIRVFKAAMQMTPGEYIKRVRMENARLFLANRELDLNVVAGLIGYANANYFGKVFKKTFGISPKAYQQMAAEKAPEKENAIPDEVFL